MALRPSLKTSPGLAGRVVLAGVTVALADMTWAVLWVRARHGTSALRVFQSVASGLLGPAAFQGGWRTALLGLTLHTTIAFAWTLVFLVALVRSPHLRHWVSTRRGAVTVGLVYGALVWLVMDWLVLPLSRARTTPPTALWFWLQLLTHPFLVGLPIVGVLAGHLPRRVVPSTRPAGMGDGRAHR